MDDINDGRRSNFFQVFDVGSGMASVSIWGIDALGGKIVQLLEVSVHYNFLLVSVLERLRTRNAAFRSLAKIARIISISTRDKTSTFNVMGIFFSSKVSLFC